MKNDLKFKPTIRNGEKKKSNLRDFETGLFAGGRQAGLSVSETAAVWRFSYTVISGIYRK